MSSCRFVALCTGMLCCVGFIEVFAILLYCATLCGHVSEWYVLFVALCVCYFVFGCLGVDVFLFVCCRISSVSVV